MTGDTLAPADRAPRRAGIRTTDLTGLAAILLRHWLLCVLILAGAVLRVGSIIADRPAVMVWGDSYGYLINASQLLPEPFHPLVYPLFLRALWWTGSVQWMVIAQHLLAILTAVAIYATLTHLGVRRWLAAIGVAPLLLDAYQIFMEQNIVAETLMEVLIAATLILIVWSPRGRLWWVTGAVAGLLIAAAILTRGVALVLIPVTCIVLLLSGRGWRQPAAILLTSVLLVGAYSAWNDSINGQFTFDEESGPWLYARVAVIGDCHQVHGIPRDEQVLCNTSYGTDPIVQPAVEDGVGFYVWDPRSPANRLRPGPHQTANDMLRDYTLRVIVGAPGPYLWSVVVDTAQFFAPTRQEVAAGQSPQHSQSFQPVTNPSQDHVLIATQTSIPIGYPSLPGPQAARWPIWWLYRYQAFGYIPGPVLAACLLLVLLAAVWGARDARGRAQREAALLFGLTGLLLVVLPAATVGVELRYLLPALPFIPAAGVLAIESLIEPARRAADRRLIASSSPAPALAALDPSPHESAPAPEPHAALGPSPRASAPTPEPLAALGPPPRASGGAPEPQPTEPRPGAELVGGAGHSYTRTQKRAGVIGLRFGVERAIRASRYNAVAGRLIASQRAALGMAPDEYTKKLAELVGVRGFSGSALSAYETGARQVPAAVLLAALELGRLNGLDAGEMLNESLGAEPPPANDMNPEVLAALSDERLQKAILTISRWLKWLSEPITRRP